MNRIICFPFKQRRRVGGVLRVAKYYSGKLRMPWEAKIQIVSLNTTDKRVAEEALNALAKERHLEHQGMLPPRTIRDAAQRPLSELLTLFTDDLTAKGRSENTVYKYEKSLPLLFQRCGWVKLRCVTPQSFCAWRAGSSLGPKSLNDLLANSSTFFRWLQRQRMASENPLQYVERVDSRTVKPYRRALSPEEAQKLLQNAPAQRAAVYLLAMETGLRRNELNQLTLAQFIFDSPQPFVRVPASISKNKKEAVIPLRAHVVEAVKGMLPDLCQPFEVIFRGKVPRVTTLRRDLENAGIPFEDAEGRRIDLHALRTTFGTNLSASGVAPRTAMELMRHSDIKLTMKTYTDASRLPLAAAVAGLPVFTLRNLSSGDTQNNTHEPVPAGLSLVPPDSVSPGPKLLHSSEEESFRHFKSP